MGLTVAKLLHHHSLGGGLERENIYTGDSDDEWSTCLNHYDLTLIELVKKCDLGRVIELVHSGQTTSQSHNICTRMAASRGLVDIMKFLLQNHSTRAAVSRARSKRGFTPLKLTRLYQNKEAEEYLVNVLGITDDAEKDENSTSSTTAVTSPSSSSPSVSPIRSTTGISSHLTPKSARRSHRTVNGSTPTPPRGFQFLNQFAVQPIEAANSSHPSPSSMPPPIVVEEEEDDKNDTTLDSSRPHHERRISSPSFSPSASPSPSPPVSPRLHHRVGHLRPILKPVSTANNARLRHRHGSFQAAHQKTFQAMRQEEEDEKEQRQRDEEEQENMTFITKEETCQREEEKRNQDKLNASIEPKSDTQSSSQIDTSTFVTSTNPSIPVPPPLGVPAAPPPAPAFGGSSVSVKSKHKPSVALKPLHWDPLPSHASSNDQKTLWSELASDMSSSDDVEEHASQLEALFAKRAPATKKVEQTKNSSQSEQPSANDAKVQPMSTIIDLKRSNNIEIAIKRFRLSWDQIRDSIIQVDWSILIQERVETLVQCSPTSEEIKQIQATVEQFKKQGIQPEPLTGESKTTNSSSEANIGYAQFNFAENFFYLLSTIPRCSTRLKLLLFAIRFPSQVADVESSIRLLASAASSVQSSRPLKQLMSVILTVGNYLNTGTNKGSAAGFKLTSLQLLEATKSNDGKSSLLDYIINHIDDRYVFEKTRKSTTNSSDQPSESESERELENDSKPSHSRASSSSLATPLTATTIPGFLSSLSLVKDAAAVDFGHVEREVARMESNLKLVHIQLAHAPSSATSPTNTHGKKDRFHDVMKQFYTDALARFHSVEKELNEAVTLCKSLNAYFGESDSSRMDVIAFFDTFARFIDSYTRSERRLREKREREAKKRQREEKAATIATGGAPSSSKPSFDTRHVAHIPAPTIPNTQGETSAPHDDDDTNEAETNSSGLRGRMMRTQRSK